MAKGLRISLMAVAALVTLLASMAWSQEVVRLRAWDHDSFGRLVFQWPRPTQIDAQVSGNRLIIRFPEPASLEFDKVRRHLGAYIAGQQLTDGGRTVVFDLVRPVRLRTAVHRTSSVVDLFPEEGGTAAAATGQAIQANQTLDTSLPRLNVRIGAHNDFTRVVFDWPSLTNYDVNNLGNQVQISFDRLARPNLAQLRAAGDVIVTGAQAGRNGPRLVVTLNTPRANGAPRAFRDGLSVVVDVPGTRVNAPRPTPTPTPTQTPAPAQTAEAAPAPAPQAQPAPAAADHAAAAPAPAHETASAPAHEPAPAEAAHGAPAAEQGHGDTAHGPAEQAAEAPAAAADGRENVFNQPYQAEDLTQQPAEGNGHAQGAQAEQAAAMPKVQVQEEVIGAFTKDNGGAPDIVHKQDVEMILEPNPDGARLSVAFPRPVPLAVFQRGGFLWMVFDSPATVKFTEKGPLSHLIQSKEQVSDRYGTVLRFKVPENIAALAELRGPEWSIFLRPGPLEPANRIAVKPQGVAQGGSSVLVEVVDTGRRYDLFDPEIGDHLFAVPVMVSGAGVTRRRQFVEFAVIPSFQGVAIEPNVDQLQVRTQRNGVLITSRKGLLVSVTESELVMEDALDTMGIMQYPEVEGRIYRYATWRRGGDRDFMENEQRMLRAIARAPEDVRNSKRMDLAEFLFSHGNYQEAMGLLELMPELEPGVEQKLSYLSLYGATAAMMNRLEEAGTALGRGKFDGRPEIALFRAVTAQKQGDYTKSAGEFGLGDEAIPRFPANMRAMFRSMYAEAAMNLGDLRTAQEQIGLLEQEALPDKWKSKMALLRARLLGKKGDIGAALQDYQMVQEINYRPDRARAVLESAQLATENDRMPATEALEKMESLRHAWRGDRFELDLLRTLGRLYVKEGRYREGLLTLRQIVTYFPDAEFKNDITQEMNDVFSRLFLDGEADNLTPVSALGLYYEFRELTPIGAKGDEMIQKLAERLVAVDLLADAATLLEHQVEYRLDGLLRSKVGTRLAVIHLLNHQPKDAIKALNVSDYPRLPDDLKNQRRHLRTRALQELGKYEDALDLIAGDDTRDAKMLRADINWKRKDWVRAAAAFNRLLGKRYEEKDKKLTTQEQTNIMQMTVAYNLSEDKKNVKRAAERYAPLMKGTPAEEAFKAITHEVDADQTRFRALPEAVAAIGTYESFIDSYRQKLKHGGLEALN